MLFEIFKSFFKIGAFTFGGGYAMIPLIEEEVVNKKKWVSKEDFLDILVVSQTFPGALAVNCAIFIGYRMKGLKGAITSLLGSVLPSFFIMLIVAGAFMKFRDNLYVDAGFKGITAAVPMLVLVGVISLSKGLKINIRTILTIIIALIALIVFDINPIITILVAALYGIIFLKEDGETK